MPASFLTARDVMSTPVFAVTPGDTVAHARNLMVRHGISRVLVIDAKKLTGILTKKDIGYHLQQQGAAWRRRPPDQIQVSEYATPGPVVVAPEILLRTIAGIFLAKNIGCVPVVDHGTVAGIVTRTDLMKSALAASLKGTVQDVMEDAVTVNRWHSLAHVITLMKERDEKLVVVNNDGSMAGIITETNLAFHDEDRKRSGVIQEDVPLRRHENISIGSGSDSPENAPVTAGDVMTSPVITVAPERSLPYAVGLMQKEQVNNLVVVENDTIVGIIRRDDILKEVAK
ncbi:MAG: CBS domain-containing protein [Methanoregula sp.]|jgi:CBS domain-containing protein|uniref:CBS domain-containing protein n=1 Tax=Methanoregula sp. TaxID=2052170 RepID=UPI003D0F5649